MKFLKLCVILMFAMTFSAYKHYTKPNTLLKYHRCIEKTEEDEINEKLEIDAFTLGGKTLFKNNCASCHNKNMKDDLTGPALKGVEERWEAYPREDLYRWVRNSLLMVDEGHPRAVEVFKENNGDEMTAFPSLTDEEIEAILAYIRYNSN